MRLDTKTGLMDIEQYWDLPLPPRAAVGEANADENRTDCFDEGRDLACSVRARMQQAVELEMVADVPICSYLSGGVDSSVITSLMQHKFAKDFEAADGASESEKKTGYHIHCWFQRVQ
jgi:asparagine synthase (glutamine-hydrolysing)